MDSIDNKLSTPAEANPLQAQFDALQHMVVSILILVIVISGTLNIYFLRQWRTVSKDLAAVSPQATKMIADYQKTSAPAMNDFVKKIIEFGRTHPDFAPVLTKYNLQVDTSTGATVSPPASPAPTAPAPAPKKK